MKLIDITQVVNSYSGGLGCACGCGGSYVREPGRALTIRVNKINRALAAGQDVVVDVFKDETCYELQTGQNSVVRVYVKN